MYLYLTRTKDKWHFYGENSWICSWAQRPTESFCYIFIWHRRLLKCSHWQDNTSAVPCYFWSTHTTRAISMFVTSVSYPLYFLQKSFVDLSWNYQKIALDTLFNLQILYLFKIPPVMPWLIFSLHSIFVCQAEYLVSSSVVDV